MLSLTGLCSITEPAAPSGEIDTWHFQSRSFDEYAFDFDLALTQASFEAAGEPYTVTFHPSLQPITDDSWDSSCLSAADRNPSLCR